MITIDHAPFASLITIPDDIEHSPERLQILRDPQGIVHAVHFRGQGYYFEWISESNEDSVIHLHQGFCSISYRLAHHIPCTRTHSNIEYCLTPREIQRQQIAINFIKQAITDAINAG